MIRNVNSLLRTLVMIMFIICSGSQFGIENARYVDIILWVVSTILLYNSKGLHLSKRNTYVAIFFIALLWVSYFFFISSSPNANAYVSYSLRLLSALFIAESLTYSDYTNELVRVISFIAIASLAVYMLRIMTPAGLGYLTSFGLFRTTNLNGTIRNAGVFWEPGAYQIFLNLALFFQLQKFGFRVFGRDIPKKHSLMVGLLVLTVISTMSTNGFILLMINCLMVYFATTKSMKKQNKVWIGIPLFFIALFLGIKIISSDIVVGKFTGTGNIASTNIRMNDILGSIEIIGSHPMGLGHGTQLYYNTLARYFIVNNSSGILSTMCQLGVIYGVMYLARIFLFAKKHIKKHWLIYFLIVFIAGLTENFYAYPIYFVMLFSLAKGDMEEIK